MLSKHPVSQRGFFDFQDIDISIRISARSYLKSSEILGELFAAEILRSPWDLGENLDESLAAEILRSRWDLGKNLGQNLGEILRSCRDLGQNLGEFLAAEIARSQKLAKIRAEILVKILQGKGLQIFLP